jgi:hypothetical protein
MAHGRGPDGVIEEDGFAVRPDVLAADEVAALARALADCPHRSRAGGVVHIEYASTPHVDAGLELAVA